MSGPMIRVVNSRDQRAEAQQGSDGQYCCQDNFNFHVAFSVLVR